MRLLMLFFNLISLLISGISYAQSEPICISTEQIGPSLPSDVKTIFVDLYYYLSETKTLRIVCQYENEKFGKQVFYGSEPIKYNNFTIKRYYVELPNKYLQDSGLTYTFLVLSEDFKTTYVNISHKIYPATIRNTIDVNNLTNRIYLEKNYAFYINKNKIVEVDDKFDFTHMPLYFDDKHYYRLNIDGLSIKYNDGKLLSIRSSVLSFVDDDELFPYISNTINKKITINLKMTMVAGFAKFGFANKMYVNPSTMEMSFTPRTKFVETKYFYLPINGASKFDNYQINFQIFGAGTFQTNFNYKLKYRLNKYLIGNCNDSNYCIVSGVK